MSAQSHSDAAAGPSRRAMLRGAGAAGAVGIAAAVGVGAASGAASAATRPAERTEHAGRPADVGVPLVVYLRDAASGELDVFAGTSHTVIRDPALVARLTHAVR
jgi:hypothetical protein